MTTNFIELWFFFFFGFKSDRGSGSWFSHSAQWGFITTGELWAFPLICLWLAPFNLKFRVKKKFKVSPRTQSTVALIMPHYLIFIFLPVTLSSTDWLMWLATRERTQNTDFYFVRFQALLKPFVYIYFSSLWQNCTADKADNSDTHELPRIASEPADMYSYLNEVELRTGKGGVR